MNNEFEYKITVGNTPLIKIYDEKNNNNIFVKLEGNEPSGSIKDRVFEYALNMYEIDGSIKKGMNLNIASSGNAAISLATLSIPRGYKVSAYMPSSTSIERRNILKMLGVNCVYVDGGMQPTIQKAKQDALEDKNSFYVDQFFDIRLCQAHVKTVEEIVNQLNTIYNVNHIDVFISGVGTGVTLKGIGENLLKKFPQMKRFAFEPYEAKALSMKQFGPHGLEGVGPNFEPINFTETKVDKIFSFPKNEIYDFVLDTFKKGLHLGITSMASLYTALNCNEQNKNILIISYDNYDKYIDLLSRYNNEK